MELFCCDVRTYQKVLLRCRNTITEHFHHIYTLIIIASVQRYVNTVATVMLIGKKNFFLKLSVEKDYFWYNAYVIMLRQEKIIRTSSKA